MAVFWRRGKTPVVDETPKTRPAVCVSGEETDMHVG